LENKNNSVAISKVSIQGLYVATVSGWEDIVSCSWSTETTWIETVCTQEA